MAVLPPLSPQGVHTRACQLIGHRAYWHREPYRGGAYSTEHFRTCSYCGCINPGDLMQLLREGGRLESTAKPGKFYLITRNPVAGELVRFGSVSGAVFAKGKWPQDLRHRLYGDVNAQLPFQPTISERLSGHFERPALDSAPALIHWPFYAEHTNHEQWPDIWAAAKHGEKNAEVQSACARDCNYR
jgi:hypothetical protein